MLRFHRFPDALHAYVDTAMRNPDRKMCLLQPLDAKTNYVLVNTDKVFVPTIPVGDFNCKLCMDLNEEALATLREILQPDLFPRTTDG